jgi:hypothetical protein
MTRPGMPLLVFLWKDANRTFTARLADLADEHVTEVLRIYCSLYGTPVLTAAPSRSQRAACKPSAPQAEHVVIPAVTPSRLQAAILAANLPVEVAA